MKITKLLLTIGLIANGYSMECDSISNQIYSIETSMSSILNRMNTSRTIYNCEKDSILEHRVEVNNNIVISLEQYNQFRNISESYVDGLNKYLDEINKNKESLKKLEESIKEEDLKRIWKEDMDNINLTICEVKQAIDKVNGRVNKYKVIYSSFNEEKLY